MSIIKSTFLEPNTDSDITRVPVIRRNELELGDRVGQGSFGNVYKGTCRGKTVAIKQHQKFLTETDIEEFKKEISILVHLRHPNVILLMGACLESEHLVIVMEYMERGDLRKVMSDFKPSLTKLLVMARDVAQGMSWLHQSHPPIIHRDLKPTNLLVDENWNVKICDFGLSVFQKTKTFKDINTAPGTLPWMAPEVLSGKHFDEKCDIYSFSILLWEMITYQKPYVQYSKNEDTTPFIKAVCQNHERPNLDKIHPTLVSLLMDCWHEDPCKRPVFLEIIDRLGHAMVDVNITNDGIASSMWKREWIGKEQVPWLQFVGCLYKELNLNLPYPELSEKNQNYRCLHRILTKLDNTGKNHVVELLKFGLFLKWLGPLQKPFLIDDLHNLLKNPWFHGDIEKQEAENNLNLFKSSCFLVRFSFTDPDTKPYTISRKVKGNISHFRVHVNSNGHGYFVTTKRKNKSDKIILGETMEGLIDKARKHLQLKKPCPGSKYSDLFLTTTGVENDPRKGYEESSSD